MPDNFITDWSDIAFGSKKTVRNLKATFIAAPRELSAERLIQLIKQFLPEGNIVLGISKEPYVSGFENQPQFRMLKLQDVQGTITKVNNAKLPAKVHILEYSQRELPFILEKLSFKRVILINGSWKYSFHTLPAFYELARQRIIPEYLSPFSDELEAQEYAKRLDKEIQKRLSLPVNSTKIYSQEQMLELASRSAEQSYDNASQTGAAIGKPKGKGFQLLQTAYNQVVPYPTFAMHHGASREQHMSPPNDLNHYDTVHAEVQGIMNSLAAGIKLQGTTLFINVLPCPVCCRVIIKSGISEVMYRLDHSDGYAVTMLGKANIAVRRLVL